MNGSAIRAGKVSETAMPGVFVSRYELLSIQTSKASEFIDVTEAVQKLARQSQIEFGTANVQTRHTTTGLLINENEPLLLEDFQRQLEKAAGAQIRYRHDELDQREGISPHERKNGHAHCKAMYLRSSETINIAHGNLDLGRWQRLFLVELDFAPTRPLSVVLMGIRFPVTDSL